MTYDFTNPSYTRHALHLKDILNADVSKIENLNKVRLYEQTGLSRESGIYIIFNSITGDYYIGSSEDTRRRKNTHQYNMVTGKGGGNVLLRKHAIKYGVDCFLFLLIHKVPKGTLSDAELFWINSLSPFYNIHTKIARRPVMSEGGKKTVSDRSKNIRNNDVYKVPVMQYTVDGTFLKEWSSIKEATAGVGGAGGHISNSCRKGHPAFGFKWQYKNGMTSAKPRQKK